MLHYYAMFKVLHHAIKYSTHTQNLMSIYIEYNYTIQLYNYSEPTLTSILLTCQ